MFTAVVMEESGRRGLWGRVADRVRPALPREEEQPLPGEGEGFRLIHCPMVPGQRHWSRLARQAGDAREELVVDPQIPLPEGEGLGRFWPREFPLLLAANTAVQSVEAAGVELSRRRIGLIDRDGRYQWLAKRLVREFAEVRVACPHPQRYEETVRELMEEHGAAVPVTGEEGLAGCLLVLDPERTPSHLPADGELLRLAPFQTGDQVVNALRCTAPAGYGRVIPMGLETTYFLGAAYELGGRKELGQCAAARCRIGGRETSTQELAARLRRRDSWL